MKVKRAGVVTIAAVVMLVGTACSSGDAALTSTTTTTPATSTSDGTEASTSTAAPPTEAPATTAAEDVSCIVGVWELDSKAFFDEVAADFGGEASEGSFVFVGGVFRLELRGDGTVVDERQDWTFGQIGDDGVFEIAVSDRRVGTYTFDGATLAAETEPVGERSIAILLDGEPLDLPENLVSAFEPPELSLIDAEITCSGDTMSAVVDETTSKWGRVG